MFGDCTPPAADAYDGIFRDRQEKRLRRGPTCLLQMSRAGVVRFVDCIRVGPTRRNYVYHFSRERPCTVATAR
eukprot:1329762-Lingulodinium_polyedra.AAC.1